MAPEDSRPARRNKVSASNSVMPSGCSDSTAAIRMSWSTAASLPPPLAITAAFAKPLKSLASKRVVRLSLWASTLLRAVSLSAASWGFCGLFGTTARLRYTDDISTGLAVACAFGSRDRLSEGAGLLRTAGALVDTVIPFRVCRFCAPKAESRLKNHGCAACKDAPTHALADSKDSSNPLSRIHAADYNDYLVGFVPHFKGGWKICTRATQARSGWCRIEAGRRFLALRPSR